MLGEQYKKESDGKTYMLLPKRKEAFEEHMIRNALPEGILSMVKSEREDVYKYEITGKKPLSVTFERVPMNAEQIEKVLRGILDVLERGREYLLTEDNFVLLPEHIYLRIPTYEVTLCYYPEYDIPFAEQLGKLFEMFLNRVDYREERAIAMVYALYMQLQEPDMTLEQIRVKLLEQTGEILDEAKGVRSEVYDEKKEEKQSGARSEVKTQVEERYIEKENKETKKAGLWEWLRKEVGEKIVRNIDKKTEDAEVLQSSYPASCVMEAMPDWGTQYTTVLAVKKTEEIPSLVDVKTGETVFLTKFPFYVGSLSEYMDYVIKEKTVSRFHGKFFKMGGDIYLTDLNSTNGTKVNGRSLSVQEQVKLSGGERIVFADAEYSFFTGKESEY